MHEWSGTNVKKENIKPTPIAPQGAVGSENRQWQTRAMKQKILCILNRYLLPELT
jgi:hypothetical protein